MNMKRDTLIKRLEGRLEEVLKLTDKDEVLTIIATRFLDTLLKNDRLAKFFYERAQYQMNLIGDDRVQQLFDKASATIQKAMRRIVKDHPVVSISRALSKKYPDSNFEKEFQSASWDENIEALLSGYVFVRYEPKGKTRKEHFPQSLSYMIGRKGNQSMVNTYKSRVSFIRTVLNVYKNKANLVDDVVRILREGDPLPEFRKIFETCPTQLKCDAYSDLGLLYQKHYPDAKPRIMGFLHVSISLESWREKVKSVLDDVVSYLQESAPEEAGRCNFDEHSRILSYGSSIHRFHESENGVYELFKILWVNRSRAPQRKGMPLQCGAAAVQMCLVKSAYEYDSKTLVQQKIKNASDSIQRILRKRDEYNVKQFPLELVTKNGLQLVENSSATKLRPNSAA
ncbi:hypothetical protein KAZ92_03000 [Candidatus Gracilibacteria bacterium]|nr:hypothetical protein [Candidatus Gracilibacteria bacterium]